MQASPANIIDYFNGEKQNLIHLFSGEEKLIFPIRLPLKS